jgi:hypothetical protein
VSHGRALSALVALSALAGCGGNALANASEVTGPRVLAIVAEPPEAAPGTSVALRALTGGLSLPTQPRWTACARPEEVSTSLPLSSYGQFEPDRGCSSDSAAGVVVVGEGSSVRFEVPSDALTREDWLAAAYGRTLSRETLLRLGERVGLPLVLTVELTHGDTVVRAFKRVLITGREPRNSNPPPPRFRIEGTVFGTVPEGDADECVPEDGASLVVAPGQKVQVVPEENEQAWLESYEAIDAEGVVSTQREQAFYNFFATAGRYDLGRARAPERAPSWTAPATAGAVTHWLVVRDGRGGTSACHYTVDVR